jgi:DNA-directed RNA polymerase subunit K/omega
MEDQFITEQDAGPRIPSEPAAPITSRFLFVDVAALRAKQLRRGARVRFRDGEGVPVNHKAERVAMEEVRRGLVSYDVPAAKGDNGGTAGVDGDA